MYVLDDASPPRKLLQLPDVTHPSACMMFVPGAVISGFSSFSGLPSPLSLLGPLDEYEAMVSSSLVMVLPSSVAPTVIDKSDDPMPDNPSLSGPSFPAATLTTTPSSIATSSIMLCMSVPSEPPPS